MKNKLFKMTFLFLMTLCLLPITYVHADEEYGVYLGDNQDGYSKALYVHDSGEERVVYCFNAHKNWPGIRPTSMKKITNVSANDFDNYAENSQLHGEELKTAILRVMYSGYPHNATGIKEKFNLSNGQFRMITQAAVWYYADNQNLDSTIFSMILSSWVQNQNIRNAYNELINSDISLPSDYQLDLYSRDASGLQAVLSSRHTADYQPVKKHLIKINKTDIFGKELEGAQLQLQNEDGKILDTWISNNTIHEFEVEAGTYILHETSAPEGYEIATDIYFNVNDDGTITSKDVEIDKNNQNLITMIDDYSVREIILSKVDSDGTLLSGATIYIMDEKGNKILDLITTNQKITLSLKPGNYIFHEENAPSNYLKVEDIYFTINKDSSIDIVNKGENDKVLIEKNELIITDIKNSTDETEEPEKPTHPEKPIDKIEEPEKPTHPEKSGTDDSNKPSKPVIDSEKPTGDSNKPAISPTTGDNTQMMLWVGMLCIGGLGLLGLRRENKQSH